MNRESLITFITVAKLKNFTQAAEQLHIVQSTVTSRIKQLEAELGETLFFRTNKKVELTLSGELFMPYAKQILKMQDEVTVKLKSSELYRDHLKIGVVHSLYDCHVKAMIMAFIKTNSSVTVDLNVGHSEELIQQLMENQLDLAFTYWDIKSTQIACKPFMRDDIILVAGMDYQVSEACQNGLDKKTLQTLPILGSAIMTDSFQSWFNDIFLSNSLLSISVNISSQIIPYLSGGFGCAFMIKPLVESMIESGELKVLPLKGIDPPKMESFMLINKQRMDSLAVQNFLRTIGE